MFRRHLYYGVTFFLLVVIVFLLMRGRSTEQERAAQNIRFEEIASESSASVRVILPRDLEVVKAEVSWARNTNEKDAVTANHEMTIRNTGRGSYVSLWLRMEYTGENGRPVETRTYEVNGYLPSGETLRVSDIIIEGLPDSASDFRASILSADLSSQN